MATIEIPVGITEAQAKEWMAVLYERKINADMNAKAEVKAATEQAKKDIDDYRASVGLSKKFEAVKEA